MKDIFWTERWRAMSMLMGLLIQMQQECGFIEELDIQKQRYGLLTMTH